MRRDFQALQQHPGLHTIIGPPGTGKTTRCLAIVEHALKSGVAPHRIAYLAFTRKAAREARERAHGIPGFNAALPFFSTIHSFVFRRLGVMPGQMMGPRHYRDLGTLLGIATSGHLAEGDDHYGMTGGDRLMFLEGMARVKGLGLQTVLAHSREIDFHLPELERYSRALRQYKRQYGLRDFTDLLTDYLPAASLLTPELDLLVVDEGQDLSAPQWSVIAPLAARSKKVYVAGDEAQAIHTWAGADVVTFRNLRGKVEPLRQSNRVPRSIHAMADKLAQRITKRPEWQWAPMQKEGTVQWHSSVDSVDLSQGNWLLLARNGHLLRELEDMCRRSSFAYRGGQDSPWNSQAILAIMAYTRLRDGREVRKGDARLIPRWSSRAWDQAGLLGLGDNALVTAAQAGVSLGGPMWYAVLDRIPAADADYFRSVRRHGGKLTETPRIELSTIHGAKGGEEQNVLLLTDVSVRTAEEAARCPEDEARVWFVGLTRTEDTLHLVQPRTGNYYEL